MGRVENGEWRVENGMVEIPMHFAAALAWRGRGSGNKEGG